MKNSIILKVARASRGLSATPTEIINNLLDSGYEKQIADNEISQESLRCYIESWIGLGCERVSGKS